MMNTNIISSTDVQRNFTQVMARMHASGEPMIVVRDSVPEAVIVGYEEYRRIADMEKQSVAKQLKKVLRQLAKSNAHFTDSEINADIKKARHATRRH